MKRFLRLIGALSFWELIGRYPVTAGVLTILGVGGGVVASGVLTPPTITPQPSTAFGQAQGAGNLSNNGLQPNGGTSGPFYSPSTPSNSAFVYVEGNVDPNISSGNSYQYALGSAASGRGLLLTSPGPGAPSFVTQTGITGGINGASWWLGISGTQLGSAPGATAGTGYLEGYFPWTATGGGCVREPSGFWYAGNSAAKLSDPGFMCNTTPTVDVSAIPGDGAKQTPTAATCASNTPVSGEMQVTFTIPYAHGVTIGNAFVAAGFTPSGYNATYTALPGSTGTTLVGETTTGGGTCPAAVSVEGTVLSGASGAVTLTAISTTNPWGTNQTTGITISAWRPFLRGLRRVRGGFADAGIPVCGLHRSRGQCALQFAGGRPLAQSGRNEFHRVHRHRDPIAIVACSHRHGDELLCDFCGILLGDDRLCDLHCRESQSHGGKRVHRKRRDHFWRRHVQRNLYRGRRNERNDNRRKPPRSAAWNACVHVFDQFQHGLDGVHGRRDRAGDGGLWDARNLADFAFRNLRGNRDRRRRDLCPDRQSRNVHLCRRHGGSCEHDAQRQHRACGEQPDRRRRYDHRERHFGEHDHHRLSERNRRDRDLHPQPDRDDLGQHDDHQYRNPVHVGQPRNDLCLASLL